MRARDIPPPWGHCCGNLGRCALLQGEQGFATLNRDGEEVIFDWSHRTLKPHQSILLNNSDGRTDGGHISNLHAKRATDRRVEQRG